MDKKNKKLDIDAWFDEQPELKPEMDVKSNVARGTSDNSIDQWFDSQPELSSSPGKTDTLLDPTQKDDLEKKDLKRTVFEMLEKGANLGSRAVNIGVNAPFRVANMPQAIASVPGAIAQSVSGDKNNLQVDEKNYIGNIARNFLNEKFGISIKENDPSENGLQRIVENAIEFAVDSLLSAPIGAFSKGAPYVGKLADFLLGSAKGANQLAKVGATSAAVGAGSQALQEGGANPIAANLLAGSAPSAASVAKSGISRSLDSLPTQNNALKNAYSESSDFLKKKVGEDNIPSVISRIDNYTPPVEGYRPLTSDIVQNEGIAQLHRASVGHEIRPQEGMPTLSEINSENIAMLRNELEKTAPNPNNISALKEHITSLQQAERKALDAEIGKIRENLDSDSQKILTELELKKSKLESELSEIYKKAEQVEQEALRKRETETRKLDKTATAEEAGEQIRSTLSNKVGSIQKKASQETKSLFESAYKETPVSPENTMKFLTKEMQTAVGDSLSDLEKVRTYISPIEELPELKRLLDQRQHAIEKLGKHSEQNMELIDKLYPVPEQTSQTEKLHNALQRIYKDIERIPPHEKSRRAVLKKTARILSDEIQKIPKLGEAMSAYKSIMEPSNIITENPQLKKILQKEKNSYVREYAMSSGDVPDSIIKVSADPVGAKQLFSEIKNNRDARNRVKHYIHSLVLKDFVGNDGKIKIDNFNRWKNAHLGAFELYPGLDKKLSSLQESQKFVDSVISENRKISALMEKKYKQESSILEKYASSSLKESTKASEANIKNLEQKFSDKFGRLSKTIIETPGQGKVSGAILGGKDGYKNMQEAINIAKKDKSGASLEGLKRDTLENFKEYLGKNFTADKFNRYLNKNGESLKLLYGKEGMDIVEKINDALVKKSNTQELGKDYNSSTVGKGINVAQVSGVEDVFKAGVKKDISKRIPFLNAFIDRFDSIKSKERQRLIAMALSDPQAFKKMLNNSTSKKSASFSGGLNKIPKWLTIKNGQDEEE